MQWIETDAAAAKSSIRQALCTPQEGKASCLEWQWDGDKVYCRWGDQDCMVFGEADVSANVVTGAAEYEYIVIEPQGGSRGKPMILFLHGFGERGGNPAAILRYGPFRYLAHGGEIPAVVIAPHLEGNRHWVENERGELTDVETVRLTRFLEQMKERYCPDAEKISCTGLSMGGRGTYRLVCALPREFSAAVVCCGRAGDERGIQEPLENLAGQRVWLFHGLEDTVVPPQRAVEAVEALLRIRPEGQYRLTLYPGIGHDCYDKAYLNGEVYRWLTE